MKKTAAAIAAAVFFSNSRRVKSVTKSYFFVDAVPLNHSVETRAI
jgi:hypothetical protein